MASEQCATSVVQQEASDLRLLTTVGLRGGCDLAVGMEQLISGVTELLARPAVDLTDGVDAALLPLRGAS